jgi:hypothetical protein
MGAYADRDRLLQAMGFVDYPAYLDSKLYARIRKAVFRRDRGLCRGCRARADGVHHDAYDVATLKGESLKRLYLLCDGCHERIEFDDDGGKLTFKGVRAKLATLLASRPWLSSEPKRKRQAKRRKVVKLSVVRRKQGDARDDRRAWKHDRELFAA